MVRALHWASSSEQPEVHMRTSVALTSAALAAACSLFSGCGGDQEAILITHAVPVSEECVADPTSMVRSAGDVVDVSFTNTGFVAALVVVNNLTQTGATGTNSGIEASEMKVTDAIVDLSMPSNPAIIDAVRLQDASFVNFSLPLASNSFVGQESIAVFVSVPPSTLQAIAGQMQNAGVDRAQMIMSTSIRAQRASNSSKSGIIESRTFEYPVEVCLGCLRACEPQADDPTACTADVCTNEPDYVAGGSCGNAQTKAVLPECCGGENAPLIIDAAACGN